MDCGRSKANATEDKRRQLLSSHDPREILGLGKSSRADFVEIKWPAPSGLVERFYNLPPDRYTTLVEGKGKR